jgi:hypothetical protein
MYIHLGDGPGDTPSCSSTNCSAVSVDPFERQPAELQKVLQRSSNDPAAWFRKLDPKNRFALTSIFNRLCRYKLWCYVIQLLKIVPGEAPFAGGRIDVPGSTPSVHFLSSSGDILLKALMSTGHFCMAHGAGASQHPGQTTLREISDSDSMHISIGPGNQFDVHIDLYSPVPEHPGSSFCSNAPTPAALRHIGRELVPEIVRKKTGIPGVQLFPDFEPSPRLPSSRPDANPPPPIVGVTWRF